MNKRLPSSVLAQVVRINFFVFDQACCNLEIVPIKDMNVVETSEDSTVLFNSDDERLSISFYDMETVPDFIILACRVHWSLNIHYNIGDVVQVLYGNEETYSGRIIRASGRRRSPWQSYTVEWLNLDDPPEDCSPWELEPFEKRKDDGKYNCSEAISDLGTYILSSAIHNNINWYVSHCSLGGRFKKLDEARES